MGAPEDALIGRYRDAYRQANSLTTIGTLLKIASLLIALVGVALAFLPIIGSASTFFSDPSFSTPQFGAVMGGVASIIVAAVIAVGGFFAAALMFVVAVLVSAQGQILKASLDCAVYASPFLTHEQMSWMLSLPAPAARSASSSPTPIGLGLSG